MRFEDNGNQFVEREKPAKLEGLVVHVHNNNVELALKKLKKMIKDSKIMVEYQNHQEFKRPGQKKREKRLQSISRTKRENSQNR